MVCRACAEEVADPFERRYRYPFTNCTHCGPRLSIVERHPLRSRQHHDGAVCDVPGVPCRVSITPPTAASTPRPSPATSAGQRRNWSGSTAGRFGFDQHSMLDDVDAVCGLHQKTARSSRSRGSAAISSPATPAKSDVVARLRRLKQRDAKPFALMARDLDVIRRLLHASARGGGAAQATVGADRPASRQTVPKDCRTAIAPGLATLGFMLPTTPLHLLMLRRMERPVVMTSGNLSDEPQVIDDDDGARSGSAASRPTR